MENQCLLESFDEEILKALKQGCKVAVVVNTVDVAQKTFLRWKAILEEKQPDKKILCYHSRFIMRDRDEKEKLLLEKDKEGVFDESFQCHIVYRSVRFKWCHKGNAQAFEYVRCHKIGFLCLDSAKVREIEIGRAHV